MPNLAEGTWRGVSEGPSEDWVRDLVRVDAEADATEGLGVQENAEVWEGMEVREDGEEKGKEKEKETQEE